MIHSTPDFIAVRDGAVLIAEAKAEHRPAVEQAKRIAEVAAGACEVRLLSRYGARHETNDPTGPGSTPLTAKSRANAFLARMRAKSACDEKVVCDGE